MTLASLTQSIAGDLDRVRDLIASQLHSGLSEVDELLGGLLAYQGKMLRPMLCLLSGRLAGGVNERHIQLAGAVEMIHLATLLHDDVLDEADRRRHQPSVNHLHGNEAAVLLGDLLLSRAFCLCVEIGSLELLDDVARTTRTICEGELSQVLRRGRYDLTESDYFEIIAGKTASLMRCCCLLGARLGGGDEGLCRVAEQFGWRLGVAFQIMDDIKDLDNGQAAAAAKTIGTDMAKEKMTLPLIHFLAGCDPDQRDRVRLTLRQGDQTGRQQLAAQLEQSGSVAYARQQARLAIDQAKALLVGHPAGTGLIQLADAICH